MSAGATDNTIVCCYLHDYLLAGYGLVTTDMSADDSLVHIHGGSTLPNARLGREEG
jgi:hypothetical protein